MTALLMLVKYGKRYPYDVPPKIEHVSGHFDVKSIRPTMPYLLHTEYSYGKRNLNSDILQKFKTILRSQKAGIPMLWFNDKWSEEFAYFVKELVGRNMNPKIIEIHPPFNDYSDLETFIKNYRIFEEVISELFPETEIAIENRFGTQYRGGEFLISNVIDIMNLSKLISRFELKLRIALDVPQLFSAHRYLKGRNLLNSAQIRDILERLKKCRDFIVGLHLWGKARDESGRWKRFHGGDLNTYFDNDMNLKTEFLRLLHDLFDDGKPRYFIPEVLSYTDQSSIISDLKEANFIFI
ncbi:MAG: hypothetical protein QW127_02510 [Archaeoglobaceae archaeon]